MRPESNAPLVAVTLTEFVCGLNRMRTRSIRHFWIGKVKGDDNSYTVGELGGKPVVLAAPRDMGTTNTRDLARSLRISFPNIMYAFVVGITGGAPFVPDGIGWKASNIHLGDIIVSTQVIEYDFGREYENGFKRRTNVESVLSKAPAEVTNFVNQFVRGKGWAFQRVLRKTNTDLRGFDRLETGKNGYHVHPGPRTDDVYDLGYRHKHRDSSKLGDTKIHFGRYASGNAVMKSGHRRDLLIRDEGVIGFEMEGAGAWEVFGTIVVKGVVDYADSHKNKQWRGYPAARAALCAAAMIEEIELPDRPHVATNANVGIGAEIRGSIEQPRILPRPPNSQYVGYASVLERLASCLLWREDTASGRGQMICVLSGMGGVGKSETILQFLDKNDKAICERFWGVFWVDCGSEASAQGDFERIGDKCGWSLTDGQALIGVKDQLASSKRPSLLILDNCDDVRTDYSRYIPNGSKVSVIMTTRLSDAKKYASIDPQDAKSRLFVQLKGLDAESAIDLVLDASEIEERGQQTSDRARQIATALDCHPLAITIASSLIRSAVYSLEEYADALQGRLAQKELLDEVSEQARYLKVSTTFEVSAEALENLASTDLSAKAALALLDILGFMHHQAVSEEMFVRAWKYEERVLSKYGSEDGDEDCDVTHLSAWHVTRCRSVFSSLPSDERTRLFRRARAHLERLSLVSVDRLEKSTSLHLMVHAWARERVSSPGEAWAGVASILALSAEGCTSWQLFTSQLVLHQEANFTIWNGVNESDHDQWHLCRILFAYAWQMCQAKSIATLKICFQLVEQTRALCHDHLDASAITEAQYLLGIAYRANGQITKAVEMLEHVVKVREKLAENHPSRLASQHALAGAYQDDGQITKAVEMLEHVVKVEEKLAEDHPSRLASQHELALAYRANGQITKAVETLEHVVKVKEKLAEDHPSRLASQHALALAYRANGQITEAVETLEHVVKVREKLAEDHPSRLASQHALAGAYLADGQIMEAVELLKPVVVIKKRKFRANHPSRIVSEDLLASLMSKEEKAPEKGARIPS
ncbi:hypothetical protein Q7P35_002239 [Cladosporium inversicolor]